MKNYIKKKTDNFINQIKHVYKPEEDIKSQIDDEYNEYLYPPDLNICLTHLKATKFAEVKKLENGRYKKCPCCGYIINRKNYSIWDNVDKFASHGLCYPLYFKFMAFSIIFLGLFFIFNSIFYMGLYKNGSFCKNKIYKENLDDYFNTNSFALTIYMNWYCYSTIVLNNSYCRNYYNNLCFLNWKNENCLKIILDMIKFYKKNNVCSLNNSNLYSFPNSLDLSNNLIFDSDIENIVKIANFILLCLLFIFWFYYENLLINRYDENLITYSDFTLQVNKLPNFLINKKLKDFKEEIKYFFENKITRELSEINRYDTKIIVTNIELPFEYSYYGNLITKHNRLIYQKKRNSIENINESIPLINNSKNKVNIKNNLFNMIKLNVCSKLSGIGYISFNSEEDLNNILNNYSSSKFDNYFYNKKKWIFVDKLTKKDHILELSKAPEPNDIIWEHLGYSKSQLKYRSMISSLFIILICWIYFSIVLWITFINQFLINNKEDYNSNFLKIFTSYVVIILNEILKLIFYKIIAFEKKPTISERESSLALMLYKYQVFNSTIPLVLSAFLRFNLFGEGGLINYVDSFLFANMYLPYLIEYFFDIFYLYRAYYRNKIKYNSENCYLVQQDAN